MIKRLLTAVCVLSATWACGGSPARPSSPPVFNQSIAGNVDVFGTNFHSLTTSRPGNLQITLSWSSGVDLDLYLVNPSCGNDGTINGCQFFATSAGSAKPELVTHMVTAGETYKIVVDNNSEAASAAYDLAISIQ